MTAEEPVDLLQALLDSLPERQARQRVSCHRCGKRVGKQGGSNVLARHPPAPGFDAFDGVCLGAGENPCGVLHAEPCRPAIGSKFADPK